MAQTVARASATKRGAGGRIITRLAKSLNPAAELLAGRRAIPVWALLLHRGRRSGRAYRTPVAIFPNATGFVIPLPFGPDTDWCRNVLAAGGCTMRWNGREHQLDTPEIVGADVALPALPAPFRAVARALGFTQFLSLRDPRRVR